MMLVLPSLKFKSLKVFQALRNQARAPGGWASDPHSHPKSLLQPYWLRASCVTWRWGRPHLYLQEASRLKATAEQHILQVKRFIRMVNMNIETNSVCFSLLPSWEEQSATHFSTLLSCRQIYHIPSDHKDWGQEERGHRCQCLHHTLWHKRRHWWENSAGLRFTHIVPRETGRLGQRFQGNPGLVSLSLLKKITLPFIVLL